MKLFLLLFYAFFNIVVGEEDKEAVVTQCLSELGIDEGLKEHFKTTGELPEDSDNNAKCAFLCISKKIGWADESAEINIDKVISFISEHHPDLEKTEIEPVVKMCAERTETDPCEKWYEFAKCQTKAYLEYKKKQN